MVDYYGDDEPDPADTIRSDIVAKGVVPPGCKLGGTVLLPLVNMKADPCVTVCPHLNRSLHSNGCGGREKPKNLIIKDTDRFFTAARADALEAFHLEQIRALAKLLGQPDYQPDPKPEGGDPSQS